MLRDLNPKFFTIRSALMFSLFSGAMIATQIVYGGMTLEGVVGSPRATICLTGIVLICIFVFVGYPNHPGRERHFVIDDSGAKRAPGGFYWRLTRHWYRGHGGRLVCLPWGIRSYIIGRNRDLRVVVDHGYSGHPRPELAERTFRLYCDLAAVKDGTVEEIEAVVHKYCMEDASLPAVALDWRGTFVDD